MTTRRKEEVDTNTLNPENGPTERSLLMDKTPAAA
jgi:hypothetical protein